MKYLRAARLALFALFAVAMTFAARGAGAEEKTLLTPDGTVYTVRSGIAADLEVAGEGIQPSDNLIEWTSLAQDGTQGLGIIPNTIGASTKANLALAYDSQSSTVVLLWKEEFSVVSVLHLGVFQNGAWTALDILPSLGIAHAYNPQMLLSHQTIHWLDDAGKDNWKTRSILSLIWWEESHLVQARYAPIFLDEDHTSSDVQVYDLPTLVGGGGPTPYGDFQAAAYMYPSLQLEGPGGAVLASFADLSQNQHFVARLVFPTEMGQTAPGTETWLRRRIPVVGVALRGEIPSILGAMDAKAVQTVVGSSYQPTLFWNDSTAVRYIRLDGTTGKWSDARAIVLTDTMTPDKATQLVQDMATKN